MSDQDKVEPFKDTTFNKFAIEYNNVKKAGADALATKRLTPEEYNILKGYEGSRRLTLPAVSEILQGLGVYNKSAAEGLAKIGSVPYTFAHQVGQVFSGVNSAEKGLSDFIDQTKGIYTNDEDASALKNKIGYGKGLAYDYGPESKDGVFFTKEFLLDGKVN